MSKKNALLEAAAEILKQSHDSAPKEPLHKAPGEVQDLGGTTPHQNVGGPLNPGTSPATPPGKAPESSTKEPLHKVADPATVIDPLDQGTDENEEEAERKRRIEAGLTAGDLREEAEKDDEEDEDEDEEDEKEQLNELSPATKSRYAAAAKSNRNYHRDMEAYHSEKDEAATEAGNFKKADYHAGKGEAHAEVARRREAGLKRVQKEENEWKEALKEDVSAILASETGLPKEFASKVGTIYEARVADKVSQISEQIEAHYADEFAKAVVEVRNELTEQVNSYLNYVVEEWMKQNELAIEKGLRSELTEEFIGGLRNLFLEHYIDIPSEKVDLVDELAAKVEELTGALNEEVAKGVELSKQLQESKKTEILQGVCEGLTQTQTEKIRTLAESVEFTAEGDYKEKVSTIRENYFPTSTLKKVDAKVLTEAQEPLAEESQKQPVADFDVARVAAAITQTYRK